MLSSQGIHASEYCLEGSGGLGASRVCPGQPHEAGCKGVDVGRDLPFIAVTGEAVSAERIGSDENDIPHDSILASARCYKSLLSTRDNEDMTGV
jgi:hypothetical protein